MTPILTLVVPCFNSAEYMARCLDSLLVAEAVDVEIVVVDDGSTDATAQIADAYADWFPGRVRAVHQANGGHGAAINTGLRAARGTYFKVVDSDDWLDHTAYVTVLEQLRRFAAAESGAAPADMVVTNFVYEKDGKRHHRAVNYRYAMPVGDVIGWDAVRRFRVDQYLLMHSLIYRTALLRECGLHVPEHSFYVDNYFAFIPLPRVQRLVYLDVDLYRYYIGRADQSVQEKVMISRIDQQLGVNLLMLEHLAAVRAARSGVREPELVAAAGVAGTAGAVGVAGGAALQAAREVGAVGAGGVVVPKGLERYMFRYANLVTLVSSVLLVRAGTVEGLAKKDALWARVRALDPELHRQMTRTPVGYAASRTGAAGLWAMRHGYSVARAVIGFN